MTRTTYPGDAHLLLEMGFAGVDVATTADPTTEEREGAQVFVLRCMEPCSNTPGAQRRICSFIEPHLYRVGIRVDRGVKGRWRWLLDRAQSAGAVRQYAEGDPITTPWLEERNLALAISAHNPELVVFMDHTDCGERNTHWMQQHGCYPTLEEERANIAASLSGARARFRSWEMRHRGAHAVPVEVVLAVGIVTPSKVAHRRRLNGVVLLETFERMTHAELIAASSIVSPPASAFG